MVAKDMDGAAADMTFSPSGFILWLEAGAELAEGNVCVLYTPRPRPSQHRCNECWPHNTDYQITVSCYQVSGRPQTRINTGAGPAAVKYLLALQPTTG